MNIEDYMKYVKSYKATGMLGLKWFRIFMIIIFISSLAFSIYLYYDALKMEIGTENYMPSILVWPFSLAIIGMITLPSFVCVMFGLTTSKNIKKVKKSISDENIKKMVQAKGKLVEVDKGFGWFLMYDINVENKIIDSEFGKVQKIIMQESLNFDELESRIVEDESFKGSLFFTNFKTSKFKSFEVEPDVYFHYLRLKPKKYDGHYVKGVVSGNTFLPFVPSAW